MSRKYIKPIAKDFNELGVTSGSCFSGLDERNPSNRCLSGQTAIPTCSNGDTVFPIAPCANGDFAGLSCYNGTLAG